MLRELEWNDSSPSVHALGKKLNMLHEEIYLKARHGQYYKLGESNVTFIIGKGRWKGSDNVIDVYMDGKLAFYMQYQPNNMTWRGHIIDIDLTRRIIE